MAEHVQEDPPLERFGTDGPDLGTLFGQCMEGFRHLLFALQAPKDAAADVLDHSEGRTGSLRAGLLERAFDGYARLRVWGHDFRAELPGRARSSLGAKLRDKPEMRQQLAGIFESLNKQLALVQNALADPEGGSQEEGDTSSGSDTDSSFSGSRGTDGNDFVSRLFQTVTDQIRVLYHLGILLRRPNVGRRYLKSGAATGSGSGYPLGVMLPEDISHVREIIRQWQNIQSHSSGSLKEEKEVSWEDIKRRNEESSDTEGLDIALIERLASANARRRGQLLYWREHPDQLASASQIPEGIPPKTRAAEAADPGKRLLDAKSVRSTSTSLFSKDSVAVSDILGAHSPAGLGSPSLAPRTTYAETVLGGSHSARVPDVPEASAELATFECPYCHLELDSAAMRDRMTWKRHVFRDLRPYICLHPACPNQDKLYATRHDWIYHEMQMHRRQWTCRDCHDTFFSREDMRAHLGSKHSSVGSSQMSDASRDALLVLHEQAMDEWLPASCPLCRRKSDLKSMLAHLGGHMEQLSLFALPRSVVNMEDEVGDEEENKPDGVSQTSTMSDIEEPMLPDDVKRMASLAATYYSKGRYDEAEQVQTKVLELRREALGERHPDTIGSMMALAATYHSHGRHDEAAQVQTKALELRREVFGERHPDTIGGMASVATVYHVQGRLDEAEQMQTKALELWREVVGERHPCTMGSMASLAMIYHAQGRYEEAEKMGTLELELRREVFGKKHPDTIRSMAALAAIYQAQDRYDEAETMEIRVLELRREVFGGSHPNTVQSMEALASIYRAQGRDDEAEQLGSTIQPSFVR